MSSVLTWFQSFTCLQSHAEGFNTLEICFHHSTANFELVNQRLPWKPCACSQLLPVSHLFSYPITRALPLFVPSDQPSYPMLHASSCSAHLCSQLLLCSFLLKLFLLLSILLAHREQYLLLMILHLGCTYTMHHNHKQSCASASRSTQALLHTATLASLLQCYTDKPWASARMPIHLSKQTISSLSSSFFSCP